MSDNITTIGLVPSVGMVIPETQGSFVLDYKQRNTHGNGLFASWTVVCSRPNDAFTPYVVWSLTARPEGWYAGQGDYCRTLDEATAIYDRR